MISENASKSRLVSQNGQGTLEYILLLVVSVAIVLMLAERLFTPFGNFVTNYFGEYLQCLLETGELPSMGGENAIGECNANFEEFTLAAGRPPTQNQGNQGGQGSGQGNGSGQGDDDDDGGGDGQDQANAGGGAGGGGGGARAPGPRAISESRGIPGGEGGGGDGDNRIPVEESLLGGGRGRVAQNGFDTRGQRDAYIPITGLEQSAVAAQRREGNERVLVQPDIVQGAVGDAGRAGRIQVSEQRAVAQAAEEDGGFSLGTFLKWLFIVLIIIAIVIFVGGQALQISKSWE